jgi:hypothetical protein
MSTDQKKLRWRVSSADGAPFESAFDAIVLPTAEGGRIPAGSSVRLVAASVPHVAELADTSLTLVVRARDDAKPLIVECEAIGADGKRQVYARASQPVSIIICSASGVVVAGLPGAAPEGLTPAT